MFRTTRHFATIATAVAVSAVAACATSTEATPTAPSTPRLSTAYELPGDRVYPEGIAADPRTGDTYVGSYGDGTVYHAAPGAKRAETFLPAGTDGRKTANGVKVDAAGRLWVIDSTAGVDIYDIDTRALIARFDVPGAGPRMVNDLAITPDGSAYLTDSTRGVVYRVTAAQVTDAAAHGGRADLTTQFDLNAAIGPHAADALTLNGIVAAESGRYLLVVDMAAGELYRIATTANSPEPIRKVVMHGPDLKHGDGLELRGDTLWAAQNINNTITRWQIADDGATVDLERTVTDESLHVPTTLIRTDNQTLVVSSQFDKGGPMGPGTPTVPFTVVTVDGI